MYDIITVGSSTIDAFLKTDASQSEIMNIHHHMDLCYPLGAKILVKDLEFFTGGGGTNTAVAFSRFGLKTAFFGNVGSDQNGEMILNELHREHVDFIGTRGTTAGYSVILDAVAHDRTIFTYRGCSDDLSMPAKNMDTKWFYFSSMLNQGLNVQKKLVQHAKKKGIKIAYNPSLYLAKKGFTYLKTIIKNTDILVCNKEEANALLNTEEENVYHLLQKLKSVGPHIVVITDGKNGVHCLDNSMFYHIPAGHVKVVEATGAGDAFASAFVASQILGKNVIIGLKAGMLNAESVIQYFGAKNILLRHDLFDHAEKDARTVITKPA
jgi:ribokinase